MQVSFTGRVNYNFQWILTSEDEVITLYDNQTFLLSSGTHYFRIYSPQSLYSPSEKYTIGLKAIHRRKAQPPAQLVEWDSPPGAKPLHFRLKAV